MEIDVGHSLVTSSMKDTFRVTTIEGKAFTFSWTDAEPSNRSFYPCNRTSGEPQEVIIHMYGAGNGTTEDSTFFLLEYTKDEGGGHDWWQMTKNNERVL